MIAIRTYTAGEYPQRPTVRHWLKGILEAAIEGGPGVFVVAFILFIALLTLSAIAGPLVLLIAIVYAVGVWLTKNMTE